MGPDALGRAPWRAPPRRSTSAAPSPAAAPRLQRKVAQGWPKLWPKLRPNFRARIGAFSQRVGPRRLAVYQSLPTFTVYQSLPTVNLANALAENLSLPNLGQASQFGPAPCTFRSSRGRCSRPRRGLARTKAVRALTACSSTARHCKITTQRQTFDVRHPSR